MRPEALDTFQRLIRRESLSRIPLVLLSKDEE